MKLTIELPDTTCAVFINYIAEVDERMMMVSHNVGTQELEVGYKDCRDYEVHEYENA